MGKVLFFSGCFQDVPHHGFFFFFSFQKGLTMMSLRVDFLGFPVWGSLTFLNLNVYVWSNSESFQSLFLEVVIPSPPPSPSSSSSSSLPPLPAQRYDGNNYNKRLSTTDMISFPSHHNFLREDMLFRFFFSDEKTQARRGSVTFPPHAAGS